MAQLSAQNGEIPDVHTLTPARLRELQATAAAAAGVAPFFRDRLAGGGDGPELAVIPAGRAMLGAPGEAREFGDLVRHAVTVGRAYAIGRHCVTADDFERYRQDNGFLWAEHLIRAEGRQPVINISSVDAQGYLRWLGAQTGQRYRLPSEAEWEYAARAGSLTAYCFGDRLTCGEANIHSLQPPLTRATGWRRFLPFCVPLNRAAEVGSYPPNVWGLFEVHGNVWELTATAWNGALDAENNAGVDADSQWLVTKGGSWFEGSLHARAAARKPRLRQELDTNLGLRVLRELP